MTDEQPALFTFGTTEGMTPMQRAAEAQLEALDAAGLLTPRHAVIVALVRELSTVIGLSARNGRGSAMAMAAKELREALALLPDDPGPEDPLAKMDDELREAERRAIAAHSAGQS
jgi:hypothetical protein